MAQVAIWSAHWWNGPSLSNQCLQQAVFGRWGMQRHQVVAFYCRYKASLPSLLPLQFFHCHHFFTQLSSRGSSCAESNNYTGKSCIHILFNDCTRRFCIYLHAGCFIAIIAFYLGEIWRWRSKREEQLLKFTWKQKVVKKLTKAPGRIHSFST